MLIALAVIAPLVLILSALVVWRMLSGPPLRREVIVHTKRPDDQSIRGVLTRRDSGWIRLESARYATDDGWVSLDEHVAWIPRASVAFVQVAAGE